MVKYGNGSESFMFQRRNSRLSQRISPTLHRFYNAQSKPSRENKASDFVSNPPHHQLELHAALTKSGPPCPHCPWGTQLSHKTPNTYTIRTLFSCCHTEDAAKQMLAANSVHFLAAMIWLIPQIQG